MLLSKNIGRFSDTTISRLYIYVYMCMHISVYILYSCWTVIVKMISGVEIYSRAQRTCYSV